MALMALLITLMTLLSTETKPIKISKKLIIREGPSVLYPIIEIETEQLVQIEEKKNGWLKIELENGKVGYLSQRAVNIEKDREVSLSDFEGEAKKIVSRHAISAGVKGFVSNITETEQSQNVDVDFLQEYKLDPIRLKHYKITSENLYSIKPISHYEIKGNSGYYNTDGRKLGAKLAISLINKYPLIKNTEWQRYLNCLGNYLVENSNAYDMLIKFFIIDHEEPNAFALPGGYVFITDTMIKAIENESELAAILAHEIGHITCFHWKEEYEKRINQIKADNSFSELDDEVGSFSQEIERVDDELENMSFEIYETIIKKRLDMYEKKADNFAVKCMINSGYFPESLKKILERIISNHTAKGHFSPNRLEQRLSRIEETLDEIGTINGLHYNSSRFELIEARNKIY